jgi:hypothetical protein
MIYKTIYSFYWAYKETYKDWNTHKKIRKERNKKKKELSSKQDITNKKNDYTIYRSTRNFPCDTFIKCCNLIIHGFNLARTFAGLIKMLWQLFFI